MGHDLSLSDHQASAGQAPRIEAWRGDERVELMPDVTDKAERAQAAREQPELPGSARRHYLMAMGAVGAGGLLGAGARYVVGTWVTDRWGSAFPWGTLLVNVSGSLALGFYLTLATARFPDRATTRLFVATGFLGAYTTFSTFSYEVVEQIQQGAFLRASTYVGTSVAAGLGAVVIGILAAQALARPRPWPRSGGRTGR